MEEHVLGHMYYHQLPYLDILKQMAMTPSSTNFHIFVPLHNIYSPIRRQNITITATSDRTHREVKVTFLRPFEFWPQVQVDQFVPLKYKSETCKASQSELRMRFFRPIDIANDIVVSDLESPTDSSVPGSICKDYLNPLKAFGGKMGNRDAHSGQLKRRFLPPSCPMPTEHQINGKLSHLHEIRFPPLKCMVKARSFELNDVLRRHDEQMVVAIYEPIMVWIEWMEVYPGPILTSPVSAPIFTVQLERIDGQPNYVKQVLDQTEQIYFNFYPIARPDQTVSDQYAGLASRKNNCRTVHVRRPGLKREAQIGQELDDNEDDKKKNRSEGR